MAVINVHHDCCSSNCNGFTTVAVRKEREETSKTRKIVAHSDDNCYVLNSFSLHSRSLLSDLIPSALQKRPTVVKDHGQIRLAAAASARQYRAEAPQRNPEALMPDLDTAALSRAGSEQPENVGPIFHPRAMTSFFRPPKRKRLTTEFSETETYNSLPGSDLTAQGPGPTSSRVLSNNRASRRFLTEENFVSSQPSYNLGLESQAQSNHPCLSHLVSPFPGTSESHGAGQASSSTTAPPFDTHPNSSVEPNLSNDLNDYADAYAQFYMA